jgi:hypothetical protein
MDLPKVLSLDGLMMKTLELLLTLVTILAPSFASDNPNPEAVWATVCPFFCMSLGFKCSMGFAYKIIPSTNLTWTACYGTLQCTRLQV